MAEYKIALSLGLALILTAACERPSAVARKDEAPPATEARQFAAAPSRATGAARIDEPVRELDGRPIWSASRRGTAEENAQRAFDRNGETFGARDLDDFVRKAHAFIEKPPAGTQRLTRANGDVLLYDPKSNVFAVATKDGAPRTMFKPDEGAAYWDEQKARQAQQASRRGGDNGES
jgi:pyocin large subunit-like protein